MDINSILVRVRPAPLAVFLKSLLRVRRIEMETQYGRFWADPASSFGSRLTSSQGYEPGMSAAAATLAAESKTFVDIGANEGYFSVLVALRMGDGGRVVAVEPQLSLAGVLQRNLEINGLSDRVEHYSYAISDYVGNAQLYLTPTVNAGSSALTRTTSYRVPTQPVSTVTLLELLSRARIASVDLLKMDIEGSEYEAILGSKEVFENKRVKTLLLEMHPRQIAAKGKEPRDIGTFLTHCGYAEKTEFGITIWKA